MPDYHQQDAVPRCRLVRDATRDPYFFGLKCGYTSVTVYGRVSQQRLSARGSNPDDTSGLRRALEVPKKKGCPASVETAGHFQMAIVEHKNAKINLAIYERAPGRLVWWASFVSESPPRNALSPGK